MVFRTSAANGSLSGKNGAGLTGMVETAFPDFAAIRIGAAGHFGAEAFCGISPGPFVGGHPERDGDQGLFAGALFCASVGGTSYPGSSFIAGSGCAAVHQSSQQRIT